jgi:hypothetical protein
MQGRAVDLAARRQRTAVLAAIHPSILPGHILPFNFSGFTWDVSPAADPVALELEDPGSGGTTLRARRSLPACGLEFAQARLSGCF